MRSMFVVGCVMLLGLAPVAAGACTGFFLGGQDGRLMAVNYDWNVSGGRLVVNTMGVDKTALVSAGATPATWRSKFGSVTFNQYGREFPIGGANQMGLAMHALWLEGSSYPKSDGPAIGALQWVQYCLDNYLSVREVVDSARSLAISSPAPLHFFACDRSGSCAVIEFLDGAPVIRAAEELPLPVLTNSSYRASIAALDRSLGYGGKVAPTDEDNESLERFVETANALHTTRPGDPRDPVDRAFEILGSAARTDNQWRIVYDLRERLVHFVTKEKSERSHLALKTLDFHCLEGGTRTLDLAARPEGDVAAALKPYRSQDNLELVRTTIARTEFLQPMPDSRVLEIAQYPDRLECDMLPRQPTETPKPGETSIVAD